MGTGAHGRGTGAIVTEREGEFVVYDGGPYAALLLTRPDGAQR